MMGGGPAGSPGGGIATSGSPSVSNAGVANKAVTFSGVRLGRNYDERRKKHVLKVLSSYNKPGRITPPDDGYSQNEPVMTKHKTHNIISMLRDKGTWKND